MTVNLSRVIDGLRLFELGVPPSITITPEIHYNHLQVALYSAQAIECLNDDPTSPVDITWRRSDTVRSNESSSSEN